MTDVDFNMIRLRLKKEHESMSNQLKRIQTDRLSEERHVGSPFGKLEEVAAETTDMEHLIAQEQRIMDQLADIDSALTKFALGTFGVCEKCGCQIELTRLEAMPTAKLCMNDSPKSARENSG